jgi:hypothetical protein
MGARARVIGVANHHHTAAIAPNDKSNSASGVRKEIGSVLREGSVDYLLASHLPRGDNGVAGNCAHHPASFACGASTNT